MTYPQNNPKSPYLLRLLQLCRHIWIWSGSEVKPEQNRSDSGMNPERMELPRMGWGGGGVMSTGGADEDFGGSLGVTLTSPSAPCPRSEEGGSGAGGAGGEGGREGPAPRPYPCPPPPPPLPPFPPPPPPPVPPSRRGVRGAGRAGAGARGLRAEVGGTMGNERWKTMGGASQLEDGQQEKPQVRAGGPTLVHPTPHGNFHPGVSGPPGTGSIPRAPLRVPARCIPHPPAPC